MIWCAPHESGDLALAGLQVACGDQAVTSIVQEPTQRRVCVFHEAGVVCITAEGQSLRAQAF